MAMKNFDVDVAVVGGGPGGLAAAAAIDAAFGGESTVKVRGQQHSRLCAYAARCRHAGLLLDNIQTSIGFMHRYTRV